MTRIAAEAWPHYGERLDQTGLILDRIETTHGADHEERERIPSRPRAFGVSDSRIAPNPLRCGSCSPSPRERTSRSASGQVLRDCHESVHQGESRRSRRPRVLASGSGCPARARREPPPGPRPPGPQHRIESCPVSRVNHRGPEPAATGPTDPGPQVVSRPLPDRQDLDPGRRGPKRALGGQADHRVSKSLPARFTRFTTPFSRPPVSSEFTTVNNERARVTAPTMSGPTARSI